MSVMVCWDTNNFILLLSIFLDLIFFLFLFLFLFLIDNKEAYDCSHMRERWHSGRAPRPYILCLPQTYLRLWVQFLSSPLCWVTA